MATITDPLCGESHPIKVSQGGKEFYYCGPSHSTVWLSNPLIKERLLGNGGRVRSARANPSGQVPAQDDEEAMFCERCARVDHVKVPIERGLTECPQCHEPIEWPSEEGGDDVDPDLGI